MENYEASKVIPMYEEFYARITGQTILARGYLAPPEGWRRGLPRRGPFRGSKTCTIR